MAYYLQLEKLKSLSVFQMGLMPTQKEEEKYVNKPNKTNKSEERKDLTQ